MFAQIMTFGMWKWFKHHFTKVTRHIEMGESIVERLLGHRFWKWTKTIKINLLLKSKVFKQFQTLPWAFRMCFIFWASLNKLRKETKKNQFSDQPKQNLSSRNLRFWANFTFDFFIGVRLRFVVHEISFRYKMFIAHITNMLWTFQ